MPSAGTKPSLIDRLFQPIDSAGLVWFRFVFGAVMVWEVCRYLAYGWVADHYIDPPFHFTYFGWDWVRPLPGAGMYVHMVLIGVFALFVSLGLFYRVSAVLFFVLFTWFFLIEQAKYLNHLYLVCIMAALMPLLPAHRAASLDALRRPDLASDTVPAWTLWLIRFQVGVVYFFGGVAKLNGDWLQGEPMRSWLGSRADYPVLGPIISQEWAAWFFSYGGLLFDLSIPFLLLWRRTRWVAVVMVVFFHAMNEYMFSIGIFPYLMTAASLVFLEPGWPRRAFPVVFRRPTPRVTDAPVGAVQRRLVVAFLASWAAVQIFMPLRHWLYPGNPSWTEEAHLYSWHMKLRSKRGRARFHLLDRDTGERWTVDPSKELTERQYRKMRSRPDMIHQYAIHLAEQARANGHPNVAVHAEVLAGLNGRKLQPLIDPTVDLGSTPRTLGHSEWILPLTEPMPNARWSWADAMERPRDPNRGTLPERGTTRVRMEEGDD